VSAAVKAHFGELDCLVSAKAILGKEVMETASDYKKVSREVYRAIAANQNAQINLVLSGPIGLSCIIGQMIGVRKYDVTVFQYDMVTKGYIQLPVADMSWV
jgi:hypothetical protein